MGHGVMRRMNSARARAQGVDAGHPPDKQSRIAQSIWYLCAEAGTVASPVASAQMAVRLAISSNRFGIRRFTVRMLYYNIGFSSALSQAVPVILVHCYFAGQILAEMLSSDHLETNPSRIL